MENMQSVRNLGYEVPYNNATEPDRLLKIQLPSSEKMHKLSHS